MERISKTLLDIFIFICFSRNTEFSFIYLEDGKFNSYSGYIEKVDVLNNQITLIPDKKFNIDKIYDILN